MADFLALVKQSGAGTIATLLDSPILEQINRIGLENARKLVALLN